VPAAPAAHPTPIASASFWRQWPSESDAYCLRFDGKAISVAHAGAHAGAGAGAGAQIGVGRCC
jgi:hypothetical protein